MQTTTHRHSWRFFRAGGLDQVRLESGADIAHLDQLDQKLWVALSCPVKGLELDEKTLAMLDSDGDGRVRVTEILGAVAFCRESLVNLDGLLAGTDAIPLASFDTATERGRTLLASSRQILAALGRPEAAAITLADIADTAAIFANTRFNGDGVVIPASTDDPALRQAIEAAIATAGAEKDRSGVDGVSQPAVDRFFDELGAYDAWAKAAEADPAIVPLGADTAAAATALLAVRAKVDDFFVRSRLVGFDPRSKAALDADESYAALAGKDLTAGAAEIAALPIARIDGSLPLVDGVNPAWAGALAALRDAAVRPILGDRTSLSEADWQTLQARLGPHLAWLATKPTTKAESLGLGRVRELLASDAKARIDALVAQDTAFEAEFANIANVERLCRYHRDLYRLLQNFTAFNDFYAPDRMAIFQAGVLYLDSRACELTVWVDDAGKHAGMAGLAKCYLAYCDLVRAGEAKRQIAAVFSGGDSDFLMVGRNGVFYDRRGRDWDATITKVVENPISLREAFFSPYKRFVRFVEEQVAKRAAAADAAATDQLASAATHTAHADQAKPQEHSFDLSSIALIGVAVSGAAAVIGGLLQAFLGLGMWMPIGFLGIIAAISGPSMLIAALKLRQRNLGPILDANGWAINGRVVVNIPFGGTLTQMPAFPAGSHRSYVDPYQPKQSPWIPLAYVASLLTLAAVLTLVGYHKGWLPGVAESRLAFLGVPHHLRSEKELAQKSVEDAKVVLTSAQEQAAAAKKTLDDLVAASAPADGKLERARNRLARAEARLGRAEDKLDAYETRLEIATEALDAATDRDEARLEAAEAAEPPAP